MMICDAADAAMKPASGETETGGDRRLYAATEGWSLDMLCVLDLPGRGQPMTGEVAADMLGSWVGFIVDGEEGGDGPQRAVPWANSFDAMETLSFNVTSGAWKCERDRCDEAAFPRV